MLEILSPFNRLISSCQLQTRDLDFVQWSVHLSARDDGDDKYDLKPRISNAAVAFFFSVRGVKRSCTPQPTHLLLISYVCNKKNPFASVDVGLNCT